jgi:tRNA threonylcarbamoyladenosine biosynthesis protein TsaE
MDIICASSGETEKVGRCLGKAAVSGDVFCLSGDLGAGKTLLCKGLAEAQGVPPENITSPTFTLMNIYQGSKNEIKHFDLYRLDSPDELTDIGFYEYTGGTGITMIEWADLFTSEMPEEHLSIIITMVPEGRKISLIPNGARYEKLLEEIKGDLSAC